LALFYGGLVRNKNVLGTIMHSFVILCLVSVIWVLWGHSLAFGPDVRGVTGSLGWFGLRGVGGEPHPTYGSTIPHQVYMLFQLMFAAITPALVTGAFAERMRFSAGSALGASALAASAFLATNTAAAMGALSWMATEWLHRGKPTTLGVASGAIAGLATVTPAAGFVGLLAAILIGLAAGAVCYTAVVWKGRFGYD